MCTIIVCNAGMINALVVSNHTVFRAACLRGGILLFYCFWVVFAIRIHAIRGVDVRTPYLLGNIASVRFVGMRTRGDRTSRV